LNKWSLADNSIHLDGRFFQLLSFEQDHNNQEWQGVFRQVVRYLIPKDYSNEEFKYVEA